MAFVYRSEKKTIPQPPHPQPQRYQSTQCRETNYKAVCKGLPHVLFKHSTPIQKENTLPIMQASPIHPGSFNFTNSVFKVRLPNESKQSKEKTFLTDCGSEKGTLEIVSANKVQQKDWNIYKTSKKVQEEKQIIVSKNLLKTMEHLSNKEKEKTGNEQLLINQSKQNMNNSICNKNPLRKWQSLKKLSPLKDYSALDQSKDINFACCIGKTKDEIIPPAQKAVKMKFNPKKLQENEGNSDDEQQEYDSQATPGPGAYSYQCPSKKQFRSKRKQFQKIFYSQIQRFKDNLKPYQEVTYVNPDKEEKSNRKNSPCQSFLSKSPKFQPSQQAASPQPGYYDTRQTLQHDLVRQILKSCNSTAFISRSPRIFKINGEDLPGPGQYTLDRSLEKLMQERNQLSFSYKPHLQRKLGESSASKQKLKKSQIQEESQKMNPIHIKQDSILEDLYMSQPVPFLSTTERFPQPKALPFPNTKQAKLSKVPPAYQVKVSKQAFNSSQKRQIFLKGGDGAGVGVYELGKLGLLKKSYNVLFN